MLTTADFTPGEMAIITGVLAAGAAPNDASRAWLLVQTSEWQRYISVHGNTIDQRETAAAKARQLLHEAENRLAQYRSDMQVYNLNQEALTMTTTPIVNATTDNQHKVTTASKPAPLNAQPRPPIPASVPESKSAALIAVENLRTKIDAQGTTLEAIVLALDTHIKDSAKGYNELHSEIAVIRGMVESIAEIVQALAATAAQPASDLDTHFGTAKITATQEDWCSIHSCTMMHHSDDTTGQEWHSHKTADGKWCRGKPAKNGKK